MFKNEVPRKYKIGPESGPGDSVWAETLSKRRPEAQDHFPSPPGPKNQIKNIENVENHQNPDCYRSNPPLSAAIPIFATRSSDLLGPHSYSQGSSEESQDFQSVPPGWSAGPYVRTTASR